MPGFYIIMTIPQRPAIGIAAIAVIAVAIILTGAIGAISLMMSRSSASTSSNVLQAVTSSSCSGYPPGGDCLATYNYTFAISVNYTGPWKLSYQGYDSMGTPSNPTNVGGNDTGTGFFS